MRPRDILNRRKKTYLTITGIGFVALTAVAFTEKYLPVSLGKAITVGASAVFFVGIMLVYVGIKCPKCNKTLGLKFVYGEETLMHCPRCNINFDEDTL